MGTKKERKMPIHPATRAPTAESNNTIVVPIRSPALAKVCRVVSIKFHGDSIHEKHIRSPISHSEFEEKILLLLFMMVPTTSCPCWFL
jgi:hypothetical protein